MPWRFALSVFTQGALVLYWASLQLERKYILTSLKKSADQSKGKQFLPGVKAAYLNIIFNYELKKTDLLSLPQ